MAKQLGLLGRKLGMTRIFGPAGLAIPVTVISAGPCPIVQIKEKGKDGYDALQVGYDSVKEKRVNKPQRGHQKQAGKGVFRHLREFCVESLEGYELGQDLTVDLFAPGERVKITGTSKGKGFQGVMKRWNFKGSPATHGHEKVHRSPGSVGHCTFPSKVFRGKKMPGQMGNKKVTAVNAEIFAVRSDDNIILVRGQVPGPKGGLVMIRKQK